MKTLWLTLGLLLAASSATAQAPDGKALYEKNCRMCHGADGTPPAAMLKMMPTLPTLNASFMASRSDDSVVKVLTSGTAKMKSFKEKLTPEEMAAVAKYLRELGKKAGDS
ncbi:MAG TPA: cytochrome c [Gemmatimonadales bacterium]|jgi:mono/diheme cytochrome c family protein